MSLNYCYSLRVHSRWIENEQGHIRHTVHTRVKSGAQRRTRTADTLGFNQLLLPTELPVQKSLNSRTFVWESNPCSRLYSVGVLSARRTKQSKRMMLIRQQWGLLWTISTKMISLSQREWRLVRDLNPWPLAWQASDLTNWSNEPLNCLCEHWVDSNHR